MVLVTPEVVYNASEGERFAADTTLEVVTCATCHVLYAIPASFKKSALKYRGDTRDGWKICCPFGHTWWYVGETDEARLQRLLNDSRDRSASLTARLDQTAASLRGTRANAARTRKELKTVKTRIAAGTCPCCSRTFQQLSRHMRSQHPEFVAAQ